MLHLVRSASNCAGNFVFSPVFWPDCHRRGAFRVCLSWQRCPPITGGYDAAGGGVTERSYLFIVGALILLALYLDNNFLFYGLALVLLIEGVSGLRPLPIGLQRVGCK